MELSEQNKEKKKEIYSEALHTTNTLICTTIKSDFSLVAATEIDKN